MKNWTIRRKILASFGVILLALIVVGAVAHIQLAGIKKEAVSVHWQFCSRGLLQRPDQGSGLGELRVKSGVCISQRSVRRRK